MKNFSRRIFSSIQSAGSEVNIFIFLWSFILGIFVSSFVFILPLYSFYLVCLVSSLLLVIKLTVKERSKIILFILVGLFAFGLGSFRYSIKDFHQINYQLENEVGNYVSLNGIVIGEPEKRENDTRITIETGHDKILVSVPVFSNIHYGDLVNIKGKLQKPGVIKSDTGRGFDYGKYLLKDDIYYTASFTNISIISSGNGNVFISTLFKIKNSFINQINKILPEPESSLLAGLVVAGKQALPENILDQFKRAGVSHIVVLSGYNITIIADFLKKIFSFLSLRLSIYASIIGIIIFTLMTGATSTVVRASIMAIIVIFGKSTGRGYSISRALFVAGFLMVLENPKILVLDPSFQLSFLAVLALVYVSPIIEKYLTLIPGKFGIRNILSTTLAAQLMVFPFLLYSMGNVSLVSLFSNMLILLIVPVTMFVGFIATTLGFINYYLALPFSYVSHLLLGYILFVAGTLGNIKFASIQISHFSVWLMLAFYILLILFILKMRQRNSSPHSSSLGS